MPARDKLLDEKQLAPAQARQDGNDASRNWKKKELIQAFSKTMRMLSSPSHRHTGGLGLLLLLKAQPMIVPYGTSVPLLLSLLFLWTLVRHRLHWAKFEMPLPQDKAGITTSDESQRTEDANEWEQDFSPYPVTNLFGGHSTFYTYRRDEGVGWNSRNIWKFKEEDVPFILIQELLGSSKH